jgi:cytochrome c biogenesis protein CcdA
VFVLGFSLIFTALGASASFFGEFVIPNRLHLGMGCAFACQKTLGALVIFQILTHSLS